MTVFVIETYVVKPEKQAEFKSLLQKFLRFMKKNPALFKEIKSLKLSTQTFGGISGAYVELIEYNSLADQEKCHTRLKKNGEYMKLYQQAMSLIDTATFSMNAWELVMEVK